MNAHHTTVGRGIKPRVNYQGIANGLLLTALLIAILGMVYAVVRGGMH